MKKPKHTIKISVDDIKTGEDGTITITQGTKVYPAKAKTVAGTRYYVVESPLTGKKLWVEPKG